MASGCIWVFVMLKNRSDVVNDERCAQDSAWCGEKLVDLRLQLPLTSANGNVSYCHPYHEPGDAGKSGAEDDAGKVKSVEEVLCPILVS